MIDDYGAGLYPDLLFHYGIDLTKVIAGEGPAPLLVILLVQRLPDTSMTVALASGGREHFGWGTDRHMQADIFDALNVNTRVSGQWKKPPNFPVWPRPTSAKSNATDEAPKKVTVADIYKKLTGGSA